MQKIKILLVTLTVFLTNVVSASATYLPSSWDDATGGINYAGGNVGIGITAPSNKLSVDGSTNGGIEVNAQAPTLFFTDQNATGDGMIRYDGNNWNFYTTSSRMNIGDSISMLGNVGVGTTAPGEELVVNGQAIIGGNTVNDSNAKLQVDGELDLFHATASIIDFTDGAPVNFDGRIRYDHANREMEFYTVQSQRMVINSSGYVGIGTTTPASILDIQAGAGSNNGIKVNRNTSATAGYAYSVLDQVGGTKSYLDFGGGAYFAGNVGIGTTTPFGLLQIGNIENLEANVDGNLLVKSDSAHQAILLEENSGNEGWRIGVDADGDLAFFDSGDNQNIVFQDGSANVGIGTTTPGSQMHLYSGASGRAAHSYTRLAVEDDDNAAISIMTPSTNSGYLMFADALDDYVGGVQYDHSNDHMAFFVNNADRITILNSGYVGIGTTAPDKPLHVYSAIDTVIKGESSDLLSRLELKDDSDSGYMTMDGANGKISIGFDSGVVAGNLNIQSNGNVGIGTTSPGGLLDIRHANVDTTEFKTGISGGVDIFSIKYINVAPYGVRLNGENNRPIILQDNSTGNVGIGTTSPGAKLQIDGSYDTQLLKLRYSDTVNVGLGIDSSGTYYGLSWFYNGNKILTADSNYGFLVGQNYQANDAPANGMLIEGNVGIGTTAPSAKLEIDSGSNSSAVRILGAAETAEIADLYVDSGGSLKIDTTAGTDSAAFIDLRSEDDQYGVVIRESDGTGASTYGNIYVTDATDDYMSFDVNSAKTGDLTLTDSGNVGIGTTGPDTVLHLHSVSGTQLKISDDTTGQGDDGFLIGYGPGAPNLQLWNYEAGYIRIGTSNSEKVRIDASGNVGIGTTAPTAKFFVDQTAAADILDIQDGSSSVFKIADGGGITIGGDITYSVKPKRSIILTAAGGVTPTTAGASQTKVDDTNSSYYVLDYDADTDEAAFWQWAMPDSYDGGAIDITFYWESDATSGDAIWAAQTAGVAPDNSEDIDPALGTAQTVTDTAQGNANDLGSATISSWNPGWAAGDYITFKIYRDADAGGDTLSGDARLVKAKIEYSVDSESD